MIVTIADVTSAAALAVDLIALYFLVGIWKDDRAMRLAAEESLKAQLEYLGLRRKWYEQRSKKKEDKNVSGIQVVTEQVRTDPGPDKNDL
jgi:hypothetical protein